LHVIGQALRTLGPTIGCTQRVTGMSKHCVGSRGEFGQAHGSVVVVAVTVVEVAVVEVAVVEVAVAVVVVVGVVVVCVTVVIVVVDVLVVDVVVAVLVVAVAVVAVFVVTVVVVVVVDVADDVVAVVEVVHEPHSEGHKFKSTSLPSCLAVSHISGV